MKILYYLLICLLSLPAISQAQWTGLGGPNDIISLYAKQNTVYAGSYVRGVNITTDNGKKWLDNDLAIDANTAYSILEFNDTLFTATEKGLYLSGDGGFLWEKIQYDVQTQSVYKLIEHKDKLILGTSDGKIYQSSDSGEWELLSTDLGSAVWELHSDGERLYAVNNDNSLFISTNDGKSWKSISSGFTGYNIYDILVIDNNIFVATFGDGILVSNDRGRSWSLYSENLNEYEIQEIRQINNIIMAGTSSGVYYTFNEGTSWIRLKENMTGSIVQSLYINDEYVYAGTKYTGVWKYPIEKLLKPELKAPELIRPVEKQRFFADSVEFKWEAIAGAAYYRLQVATDTSFEAPVFDIDQIIESTHTINNIELEKKYYWRVCAVDFNDNIYMSDFSEFFTYDASLTGPVELVSPMDMKVGQQFPEFKWSATKRAITYKLKVLQKEDDGLFVYDSVDNIMFHHQLDYYEKQLNRTIYPLQYYYWLVEVNTYDGRVIPSDTAYFYTNSYLGIPEDANDVYFSIYPNPAVNQINIKLNNFEPPVKATLYDINGAIIKEYDIYNKDDRLSLENVTKGVYYLIISNKRKHFQEKILIK